MTKSKYEMQLKLFNLNNDRVLEEFQKALQEARELGYEKVDLKFKAYGTNDSVVPEGQMGLFEEMQQ